jgi:hypothetical protein
VSAGRRLPLVLLIALGAACGRVAHVGTLDRMDVSLAIAPDASMEVQEDLTVGTGVPPGTVITRTIAPEQADALEFISAQVDHAFAAGRPEGVTIDGPGRRVTVRWQTPAGPGAHVLTIRYRAFRVLFIDEPRARLQWQAWPRGRGFSIAAARLSLALPPGVRFYEGTGVSEAGWAVQRTPTGIVADRSGIPDTEGATLVAELDLLPSTMAEPEWQGLEDRQLNYLPSYVSAALFMFVVGWGTLFLLRKQYPRRDEEGAPGDAVRPDPDKLMVARGLRFTAWLGAGFALGLAIVSHLSLGFLGVWLQLIPASMILVALAFALSARRWEREARE